MTSTCTPGMNSCALSDADTQYAFAAQARGTPAPQIFVAPIAVTFSLEMTSDDFDATTTTCLVARGSYGLALQFNQTGNKLTFTTTTGSGAAAVPCTKLVRHPAELSLSASSGASNRAA